MNKYINVDLKKLSVEELQVFLKENEDMRVQAIDLLVSKSSDFEIKFDNWLKSVEKKESDYITLVPKELKEFIRNYIFHDRDARYGKITIEEVLEKMEKLLEDEEIDKTGYEELCKSMMDSNFGSVVWNW